MEKTIFLHIGHFKTGTTALQVFMDKNQSVLAKSGFEYPEIWMHNSKHSPFAFSILRAAGVEKLMYDYRDPTTPSSMWNDLYNHVEYSRYENTIISSEEFMRIGQFPKATGILEKVIEARPKRVKIKAIAYLRDPASHLTSWYNQLIKMNFPLADLNAAVDGDIEDIHFDYKLALKPWIDILGAESMLVRPYVHDRENPSELHLDFMSSLGIEPPSRDFISTGDPNPRFDDRVLEIVRLMQNLNFPRPTIRAIRSQALSYLEAQDALRMGSDDGTAKTRERAKQAINWVSELPNSAISSETFLEHLPQPIPREVVERNILLGFVFSEFIRLRQRVNNANLHDLDARLAEIEARLSKIEKS